MAGIHLNQKFEEVINSLLGIAGCNVVISFKLMHFESANIAFNFKALNLIKRVL